MEHLWAPWRIQYIRMEKPSGCFFCQAAAEPQDSDHLVLLRGDRNFALLNSFPYNPGHLLVAPLRHTGDLAGLDDAELHEHFEMVRRLVAVMEKKLQAQGFNVGLNLGVVAGAGVSVRFAMTTSPQKTGWNSDNRVVHNSCFKP